MKPRLAKALIAACMEVHRRRLWTRVPADTAIGVRVPGEEHPLVALVMGQSSQEYGILALRGPRAFELVQRMTEEGPHESLNQALDFLSATVEPWSALPGGLREPLQKAGYRARREQLSPRLSAKHAQGLQRFPGARDGEVLLACLQGLLGADERGELSLRAFEGLENRMLLIEVGGSALEPLVTTSWVPRPAAALRNVPLVPTDLEEDELPSFEEILGPEPPILDATWWTGRATLPSSVHGRNLEALIVMRLEDGFVLTLKALVEGSDEVDLVDETYEALIDAVERAPEGEQGFPRELQFGQRDAAEELGPELSELGVEVRVVRRPPAAVTSMLEQLSAALGREGEPSLPAADDLAGWKAAESAFVQRILGPLFKEMGARLRSRFFGGAAAAKRALADPQDTAAFSALVEWYCGDHRATKRSSTPCEKLLARGDLAQVDRLLLEARRDARLSLYRVASTEPGSHLELECLLDGERFQVHDRAMSGSAPVGSVLPLRLLSVGDWILPTLSGPGLSFEEAEVFLSELESAKGPLTPSSLRAHAERFGLLWDQIAKMRSRPIRVQNTDGDPIRMLCATFRLGDPNAFARALGERPDVDLQDDGSFVWFREDTPRAEESRRTLLGRIEILGDEALLEVNSEQRLARARAWLEALPSARFQNQRELEWNAPDDILPTPAEPASPEILALMMEHVEASYVAQLDQPVPLFGHRTPRELCKSASGRAKVERWIRSLPPIGTPGGSLEPPRDRLRRELGLDSAS